MQALQTQTKKRSFSSIQHNGGDFRRSSSTVPKDIIHKILCRVPAKTLVRFKLACKSWKALISDPYFIQQWDSAAKKKALPRFIVLRQIDFSLRISTHKLDENGGFNFFSGMSLYNTEIYPKNRSIAAMHCEGLIVIPTRSRTGSGSHSQKILLCNPATREITTLPEPPSCQDFISGGPALALGFDRSTNMYKVVRYYYRACNSHRRTCSSVVEVFAVGPGGAWRPTAEDPPYPMSRFDDAASVGGGIYRKIDNRLHRSSPKAILRFDLGDEKYRVIRPPPCFSDDLMSERSHFNPTLVELQGSLCCFHPHGNDNGDIWTTRDFESHSWTLGFRIRVEPVPRHVSDNQTPIAFHKGQLLLHYEYSGVQIYDEDSELYHIGKTSRMYYYDPEAGRTGYQHPIRDGDGDNYINRGSTRFTATGYIETIRPL